MYKYRTKNKGNLVYSGNRKATVNGNNMWFRNKRKVKRQFNKGQKNRSGYNKKWRGNSFKVKRWVRRGIKRVKRTRRQKLLRTLIKNERLKLKWYKKTARRSVKRKKTLKFWFLRKGNKLVQSRKKAVFSRMMHLNKEISKRNKVYHNANFLIRLWKYRWRRAKLKQFRKELLNRRSKRKRAVFWQVKVKFGKKYKKMVDGLVIGNKLLLKGERFQNNYYKNHRFRYSKRQKMLYMNKRKNTSKRRRKYHKNKAVVLRSWEKRLHRKKAFIKLWRQYDWFSKGLISKSKLVKNLKLSLTWKLKRNKWNISYVSIKKARKIVKHNRKQIKVKRYWKMYSNLRKNWERHNEKQKRLRLANKRKKLVRKGKKRVGLTVAKIRLMLRNRNVSDVRNVSRESKWYVRLMKDRVQIVKQKQRSRVLKKWRYYRKKRDPNVKIVFHKGRKMRCISKTGGRKIYRPLRRKLPDWWKTKPEFKMKQRKRGKPRWRFIWWWRARNLKDAVALRKRKLFVRKKQNNDYMNWKLRTNLEMLERKRKKRNESAADRIALNAGAQNSYRSMNVIRNSSVYWRLRGGKNLYVKRARKYIAKLRKLKCNATKLRRVELKLERRRKRTKFYKKKHERKMLRRNQGRKPWFKRRKKRWLKRKPVKVKAIVKKVKSSKKVKKHKRYKQLSKKRRLLLRRINHSLRKPSLMLGDYYPINDSLIRMDETSQIVRVRNRRRYKKRNLGVLKLHNRVDFAYRIGSEREQLLSKWINDSRVAKDKAYSMSENKFDATWKRGSIVK